MQSEIRLRGCLRIVCVALVIVIVTVANCFATDLINSFKSFNHQGPVSWTFSSRFGSFYDSTDMDFAVPGQYSIHLYKNSGYGAFYFEDSIDWGTEVLTACDFNNDGYTDLVAKGADEATNGIGDYELFINSETFPGAFEAIHCPIDTGGDGEYQGSYMTFFGKTGDLNGDGYPDCAHWIADGSYVGLMFFDPDSGKLVPSPNNNGVEFIKTACTDGCQDGELVDLDLDGHLDIVTANGEYRDSGNTVDPVWVSIFTNSGTGSFSKDTLDPEPGISYEDWAFRITSGLLDADTCPDVVVARQEQSACDTLILYTGSCNGLLTRAATIALEYISWLSTADLDGNGHADIIAGVDDSIVIFYNDGSLNFTTEIVKPGGGNFAWAWCIESSDVDADGDIDLLVSEMNNAKTWVCYNHDVADTAGDCNADDVIDIYDYLFLYDYLYSSGDAPTPWYAGDCNFDGSTDANDLSYIADYLFNGGPSPFVH